MSALTDLVDDFDIEFDHLRQAQDAGEQRRALRCILGTLYALRCHRRDNTPLAPSAYDNRAEVCQGGRVTEGVILLRGQMLHKVTKRYAPEEKPFCPGPKTFPGNFTYPGANLEWLNPTEMPDPLPPRVIKQKWYAAYVSDVAGLPVLETLQIAKDFLVNDALLGPLP